MKRMSKGLIAAALLAAAGITVQGSSHREALAVLNEPCADNTDTYAWVSDGAHDKLYLIMNFNPLHEPGQGNQGLRACNGYRYEFHIGKGHEPQGRGGLPRRVHEHARSPKRRRAPTDPLGGGNELLWQLTGGTETMKVTRIESDRDQDGIERRRRGRPRQESAGAPEQPRPADRSARLRPRRRSRATTPAIPRAVKSVSTIRRSSTPSSTRWRTAGGSSPASSTIPISSTRRASSISSTWPRRSRRHPGRAPPAGRRRVHGLQRLLDRARGSDHATSSRTASRTTARCMPNSTDSLLRVWSSITPPGDADRRSEQHHHRPQGLRRLRAGRPQCAAAVQRRPGRDAASDALPAHQPAATT